MTLFNGTTMMRTIAGSWLFKRCAFALFLIAYSSISTSENLCFNDLKLAKLQADLLPETVGVLLYVWSPRMAMSAQHAATAQAQAQARGLGFVALHDAQVGDAERDAALQRMAQRVPSGATLQQESAQVLQRSLPLCAPALLERDAQRHFPTAWVLSRRGLHPQPIVGAMPAQAWALSLAQRGAPSQAASSDSGAPLVAPLEPKMAPDSALKAAP